MAYHDLYLLECDTYADYVDKFVNAQDIKYLRNTNACRQMVILGLRSRNVYTPEQFALNKQRVLEFLFPVIKERICVSKYATSTDPVVRMLAEREYLNVNKSILTIIFLSARSKSGFQVSGFIDFEESLRHFNLKMPNATNWISVFQDRVKLMPKRNHLSFVNWHTKRVYFNNTDNFDVIHHSELGLIFKHRGDHKLIVTHDDGKHTKSQNINYKRTICYSEKYGHVVLYDHVIRKKT